MKIGTLKHYKKFEKDFLKMYKATHNKGLSLFNYINVINFDMDPDFIDSYKLLEEWNEN